MKKDLIYSFKSLLTIKDRIKFSINHSFEIKEKIIKINNTIYFKERNQFPITKYNKDIYTLKTFNSMSEHRLPILINHTIFKFYISKYEITNKYLIDNIAEYYRVTKVLIDLLNKKYGDKEQFKIEINHDVVFNILKYNENKLNDLEKYKKEKVENIFDEKLFNIIRRL